MADAFTVQPLGPVGAAIHDLDVYNLGEEDKKRLYGEWMKYGVLAFPGAGTDSDTQLELSRVFGPLERHPVESLRMEGRPDLICLGEGGNKGPGFLVNGELLAGYIYYHQDTSYTRDICKGGMLRMVEAPSRGGDTIFVDAALAYEELPADLRAAADRLETVQGAKPLPDKPFGTPGLELEMIEPSRIDAEGRVAAAVGKPVNVDLMGLPEWELIIHPMVTQHPETGRKQMLLSPLGYFRVVGMPQDEGDQLYHEILQHVLQPKYQYRHQWAVNDMVLWDNRRMLHHAVGYPYTDRRVVHRTTLGGAHRTGRFEKEAA